MINIQTEFERIFSRNIITIAFGEDICDEKFEVMIETETGSKQFKPKMVSIREALHYTDEMLINVFGDKMLNPINLYWKETGKLYSFNDY